MEMEAKRYEVRGNTQTGKRGGERCEGLIPRIVENVRDFFRTRRRKVIASLQIVPRTAEATGVSEMSVKWIHKEYLTQDCIFLTPVKRYSISRIRVDPDSFDRVAVKRIFHGFYHRREYPTISGVLEKAKNELAFCGDRLCMCRLLKEVGDSRHHYVLEQQHIPYSSEITPT